MRRLQPYCLMKITPITSLSDPGMEVYASLTEAQLADGKLSGRGLFIAESGKVIHVALSAGYRPVSLLTEEKHLGGYAAEILKGTGAKVTRLAFGLPADSGIAYSDPLTLKRAIVHRISQ